MAENNRSLRHIQLLFVIGICTRANQAHAAHALRIDASRNLQVVAYVFTPGSFCCIEPMANRYSSPIGRKEDCDVAKILQHCTIVFAWS